MRKANFSLISFTILTLLGVILAGSVFFISETIKTKTTSELTASFSDNVIKVIERNLIEIEEMVNYSNAEYILIKQPMPDKIGPNSYTVLGAGDHIIFKSDNYGYKDENQITQTYFNLTGLFFSGNKEMIFVFNSSKSNNTIALS